MDKDKNMDIYKDNGILLVNSDLVKYTHEVVNMGGESDKQLFNSVYPKFLKLL